MNKDDLKLLVETNQRCKNNEKRLDEHDKKIKELSDVYIALTKVNDKVDVIDADVKVIKTDIEDIKNKPAKRIETIISCLISAIVAGVIGFLFARLGLK